MFKPKSDYEIQRHNAQAKAKYLTEYKTKHAKKYKAILKYAEQNWGTMQVKAEFINGGVSIADQIEMGTGCPYTIAEDVAQMINLRKQVFGA